jgi:RNA polymerase sigma factor (sigma-70 family)
MPDRRSDERLARAVGAGDEAAFAAIDARYRRALLGYAVSIVRHRQDAEDVVQAALLNALRALREDRRRPPLRPWLFCIAHNEAVTVLRRRRPQLGLDELSLGVRSLSDDVELRERLGDVLADLQRLPVRQRSALVLRELGDLGYDEVAVALQTTPQAARQAVRAARLALAEEAGGRSAACSEVRERLATERRRTRRTRAHLRACAPCREFAARAERRRRALAALLPVPGPWLFTQLLAGPTAKVAVAAGLVGAEVAPAVAPLPAVRGAAARATASRPARATVTPPAADKPATLRRAHPASRTVAATAPVDETRPAAAARAAARPVAATVPTHAAPLPAASGARTPRTHPAVTWRPQRSAPDPSGTTLRGAPPATGSAPAPGASAPGQLAAPTGSGSSDPPRRPPAVSQAPA